jgi:hypothetical protein
MKLKYVVISTIAVAAFSSTSAYANSKDLSEQEAAQIFYQYNDQTQLTALNSDEMKTTEGAVVPAVLYAAYLAAANTGLRTAPMWVPVVTRILQQQGPTAGKTVDSFMRAYNRAITSMNQYCYAARAQITGNCG